MQGLGYVEPRDPKDSVKTLCFMVLWEDSVEPRDPKDLPEKTELLSHHDEPTRVEELVASNALHPLPPPDALHGLAGPQDDLHHAIHIPSNEVLRSQ